MIVEDTRSDPMKFRRLPYPSINFENASKNLAAIGLPLPTTVTKSTDYSPIFGRQIEKISANGFKLDPYELNKRLDAEKIALADRLTLKSGLAGYGLLD
jgi:hypothetical protein